MRDVGLQRLPSFILITSGDGLWNLLRINVDDVLWFLRKGTGSLTISPYQVIARNCQSFGLISSANLASVRDAGLQRLPILVLITSGDGLWNLLRINVDDVLRFVREGPSGVGGCFSEVISVNHKGGSGIVITYKPIVGGVGLQCLAVLILVTHGNRCAGRLFVNVSNGLRRRTESSLWGSLSINMRVIWNVGRGTLIIFTDESG